MGSCSKCGWSSVGTAGAGPVVSHTAQGNSSLPTIWNVNLGWEPEQLIVHSHLQGCVTTMRNRNTSTCKMKIPCFLFLCVWAHVASHMHPLSVRRLLVAVIGHNTSWRRYRNEKWLWWHLMWGWKVWNFNLCIFYHNLFLPYTVRLWSLGWCSPLSLCTHTKPAGIGGARPGQSTELPCPAQLLLPHPILNTGWHLQLFIWF